MTRDTVSCTDCGAFINTATDTPENRTPCSACGKNRRIFNMFIEETIILRDGLGVKAKRPGESRPYVEDKAMPSFSYRLGKYVLREQIIDRDNNRYFEKVTDYESGEIIHHNEEPLSEHRGHGTAKAKKRGWKVLTRSSGTVQKRSPLAPPFAGTYDAQVHFIR